MRKPAETRPSPRATRACDVVGRRSRGPSGEALSAKLSSAWLGTSATSTAILLCGLATGILSARLLAPEGRGALAAVLFWPQLITSLGLLNLPSAMIFRRGRPDVDRAAVAAAGAWLALGLSAIGALAGHLALPLLLRDGAAAALAQLYLIAFLPFNFLALALLALDQSDLRFARYNLTRLLPSGVYLVGLLVLCALDAVSVASLVWACWLGTAVTALVRLCHSRDALRARPSLAEARRLVVTGARLHGAALLAALLAQADRFVVITFWDHATLGLYVVALTLAAAGLDVVTGAFGALLLPRLAAAKDAEAHRRIMGQTLRYATLLLTAGTALLLILCPWLLPFLFGDAYAGAVVICLMLLVAYLPTALRFIIIHGLAGTGDWRPRILAQGLALVTFAVAVRPLAARLGILGIPTALFIANGVALAYLLVFLRRRLALSSRECWGLSLTTARQVWWHGRALVRDARPAAANG
ncbi:MAG TPA: oligosaccharide flippase family protein [Geminicoccaceae bacterium]|nr:oligosaccharide flippase family protein [Geminicoccaceae bacterium]